MDFNELKQKMDSITLELKAKAPKDLSLLVDSLGFMINVMLEMTSSVLMQSETQTEQIKKLIKKNDDLGLLIDELQETIRDLKSQLNQNSNTAQNHHQAMVTKRVLKEKSESINRSKGRRTERS